MRFVLALILNVQMKQLSFGSRLLGAGYFHPVCGLCLHLGLIVNLFVVARRKQYQCISALVQGEAPPYSLVTYVPRPPKLPPPSTPFSAQWAATCDLDHMGAEA